MRYLHKDSPDAPFKHNGLTSHEGLYNGVTDLFIGLFGSACSCLEGCEGSASPKGKLLIALGQGEVQVHVASEMKAHCKLWRLASHCSLYMYIASYPRLYGRSFFFETAGYEANMYIVIILIIHVYAHAVDGGVLGLMYVGSCCTSIYTSS